MAMKRYRVSGRVQGVGFRYFVWREAASLGLTGWVRNMADGSVESLAAGAPQTLERFKQRLEEGPRSSSVTTVSVANEANEIELDDGNDPTGEVRLLRDLLGTAASGQHEEFAKLSARADALTGMCRHNR